MVLLNLRGIRGVTNFLSACVYAHSMHAMLACYTMSPFNAESLLICNMTTSRIAVCMMRVAPSSRTTGAVRLYSYRPDAKAQRCRCTDMAPK